MSLEGAREALARGETAKRRALGLEDPLEKAGGHKYIARTPNPNPPPRWRYRYAYTAQTRNGERSASVRTVGYGHKFAVGDAFKDAHEDHVGHWHVTAVDEDGVTFRHDETGEVVQKKAYLARDFVNELHAKGHKAVRDERITRYRADAKAAAAVAIAAGKAFDRDPTGENAIRLGRAWRRVRARAVEAKWGAVDIARELGADKMPKDPAALDRELKAAFLGLEGCGIDLAELRTTPSLVFAAGDPDRIRQLARFAVLAHYADHLRRYGGYGYSQDADRMDFPDSWLERGDESINVRELPDAERLAGKIKGPVTERKVINALKDDGWAFKSTDELGRTAFWIHSSSYSAPYGQEGTEKGREVHRIFDELARTRRGFLPMHGGGAADYTVTSRAERWIKQAVENAISESGGGGPRPELLEGDPPKMPSADELLQRAADERGATRWYGGEDIDEHTDAVRARLAGFNNPIVSISPDVLGARDKGKWRPVQLPLDVLVRVGQTQAKAKTAEAKRDHAARWGKVGGILEDTKGKVGPVLARAAGGRDKRNRQWLEAEAAKTGGDAAAALAEYARKMEVYTRWADGGPVKPFHYKAAFVAAHSVLHPRPHPPEVTAYGADTTPEVKAELTAWRDAQGKAYDELHGAASARLLKSMVRALGHKPDVRAAAAKLVRGTTQEIRAGFVSYKKVKEGEADEHTFAPYDIRKDPGGLRHLFAFCAPEVVPTGVRIDTTSKGIRAHADHAGVCRVSTRSGRDGQRIDLTLIHEFGHQIEHANPGITEACNTLRDQRSRGEKRRKLNDIHAFNGEPSTSYEDHEVAYEDKWENAYTGKWYGHMSSTEVLSMGVERLIDDPEWFAIDDPEHFHLIVSALSGAFGAATPGHFESKRKGGAK